MTHRKRPASRAFDPQAPAFLEILRWAESTIRGLKFGTSRTRAERLSNLARTFVEALRHDSLAAVLNQAHTVALRQAGEDLAEGETVILDGVRIRKSAGRILVDFATPAEIRGAAPAPERVAGEDPRIAYPGARG